MIKLHYKSLIGYIAVFVVVWIISTFVSNMVIRNQNLVVTTRLNSEFIYAVCRRFSKDEAIDLHSSYVLSKEIRNTKAKVIFADTYKAKLNQIKNKCPNAMNIAEKEYRN